ncbi:MAG: oligosaccharide flippase family protein [Myxococcales bacterium]|nr:oligosaccharide flippase family protein [Myxococcales bacterium]
MPPPSAPRGGAVALAGAKAWLLVTGLGLNVALPLAVGQSGFGAFKRATAFLNILSNVVVVASIQGVSRAVSYAPAGAESAAASAALRLHALVGAILSLGFFLAVPAMTAMQRAPHLGPALRVLSVILFAYAIHASLVGALNGRQALRRQALLDATYGTLRPALIVGLGFAIAAPHVGFAVASFAILPLTFLLERRDRPAAHAPYTFDARAHLAFLAGLLVVQLAQSLLIQIDILVLGRAVDPARADAAVGLYAQAQAFGLVPYQLLLAAMYALFPQAAKAAAEGDVARLRADVARGGHLTLMAVGAVVVAVAGAPHATLLFAFGAPSVAAAPVLRAIALGHGATALASVGLALLSATRRTRQAAVLAVLLLGLATLGCAIGARHSDPLLGTGVGLAVGSALAAAVAVAVLSRNLGPWVRLGPLVRVSLAAAAAMALGSRIPAHSRLFAPLVCAAPLAVYLGALAAFGDLRAFFRGIRGA